MLVIILISVLVIYLTYIYLTKINPHWKKRGVFCEERMHLMKDFVTKSKSYIQTYDDAYKKYANEPAVGFFLGFKAILMLKDPTLIKSVLSTDFNSFVGHGIVTDTENDFLSDNVLFMTGKRWKLMRQTLSPTFTPEKLKKMTYLIAESAEKLEEYLKIETKKNSQDVSKMMYDYTSHVITACALGIDSRTLTTEETIFRSIGRDFFDLSIIRTCVIVLFQILAFTEGYLKINIFKSNKNPFPKIMNDIFEHRQRTKETRHDFIDLCLKLRENGVIHDAKLDYEIQVTDKVLSAQAFLFYLAGVDTSGTTLGFIFYELAKNPEVLEKVQAEVDSLIEKHSKITYECLDEADYIDKVINETLRMYPPIGFVERQCNVDEYKFTDSNIVLKRGDKCVVPIFSLQRDEKYYANPLKFDPDRDMPADPTVYLPFGAGPRVCLGMRLARLQLKSCIIAVLRQYIPVKKSPRNEELQFVPGFIALRPKDLGIKLNKRN